MNATTAAASETRSLGLASPGANRAEDEAASSPIFVFMAILFVLTALASFAPTSVALISRVYSGQQPIPPFIVHFHAAAMSSWLLLLLTQTVLAHKRMRGAHRALGLLSLLLAPCVIVSMYGMDVWGVATFDVQTTVVVSAVAPDNSAQLRDYASSILVIHGASYVLFPFFYSWAFLVRRMDNETHKRTMVMATLVLMIPGLGRLLSVTQILPDFGMSLVDARHLYLFALIAPALVYEVVKQRVPHWSYLIGLGLLGGWAIAAHFLWTSSWWTENAPKLLGIA